MINKLKHMSLEQNFEFASLDVISLFINVPCKLIIDLQQMEYYFQKKNIKFSKNKFIIAIRFVFNYTFFKFNNKINKQTFESPMG